MQLLDGKSRLWRWLGGSVQSICAAATPTNQRLEDQLLAIAIRSTPFAIFVNLVNGALLVAVLAHHSAPLPGSLSSATLHLEWLLGLLIACACRGVAFALWRRFGARKRQRCAIRLLWYAGVLSGGACWGVAAIILWPQSEVLQGFLLAVLGGMCAGSATSLSSVRLAMPLYLCTIAPFALWQILHLPNAISVELTAMTGLFFAMLLTSSMRTHGLIRVAVRNRMAFKEATAKIDYQAAHDTLTKLANRHALSQRLAQSISSARMRDTAGALIFSDLDGLKQVNDSMGHYVGDEVLKLAAERVAQEFRESDLCARVGGDEFAVLLPDVGSSAAEAMRLGTRLAERMRTALARPFYIEGHEIILSASIGVASFPTDSDDPMEAMRHADAAMHAAKRSGRNVVQAFDPQMDSAARDRLELERDLRAALRAEQFVVHYQPQVDIDGRIIGLEALVRWRKPGYGLVFPDHFIRVAEDSGLIFDLHDQVFQIVLADLTRLLRVVPEHELPIFSVNLSPREFHRPGFVENLIRQTTTSEVPAEKLCLEITEGTAMQRVDDVIEKMRAARAAGIRFAIDDFGTGYSSLSYLKRLPVDALKIDRSFVRDILSSENDAVIVQAILDMAQRLQLKAIAEGVENEEIALFLRENGCEYFQGWHYGRSETIETWYPNLEDTPSSTPVATEPATTLALDIEDDSETVVLPAG